MAIQDKFDHRVGYLVKTYDPDSQVVEEQTPDNKNKRVININITSTLPLMVMPGELYTDSLYTASADAPIAAPDDILGGVDTDGNFDPDRFVLIGLVKGPIYKNRLRLYYDSMFKDIIVIPDISFADPQGALHRNAKWDIEGYRIGGGKKLDNDAKVNTKVTLNENDAGVKLPVTKSNVALTTSLHTFGGAEFGDPSLQPGIRVKVGDDTVYSRMIPQTAINFGKGSELFEDSDVKIPVYVPYQGKINDYRLSYIDATDVKDLALFAILKF